MTKIFFDTEFMEDGKVILPLSLGFVAETGRRLYLEIADADLTRANPWVQENVLPHLAGREIATEPDPAARWGDNTLVSWCLTSRSAEVIEEWVQEVCPVDPEISPFPMPEFWADYGSYDWILLCQLFGPMIERPVGWPMFVRDIQQLREMTGYTEALPEPAGQAHNALDDALNVQERYEILTATHARNMIREGRQRG